MRTIVVGGGVIGLACAVGLARTGRAVRVIDAAPDLSAPSWNNAGHIAVEQVAPLASPATIRSVPSRLFAAGGAIDLPIAQARSWLPFAWRMLVAARPRRFRAGSGALGMLLADALPAWHRLADTIGDPDLVRADGHLIRWRDPAAAARGRAAWARADTGTATLVDPTARDRALLATLAGDDPGASTLARFDGSGHIRDLGALATALRTAFAAAGGAVVADTARLVMDGGRAVVDGHDGDTVLVAAGVGSGPLMRAIGHPAPIVAERGYHIRAVAEGWPADAPPIVFEDRALIVTRYAGCVQASSFVEFAAADAPADPRKWDRLERHVAELGLPMAPPYTRWMGARPTLPDYLPAIGRSRRAPNLFYAFGHQHLGLTLAATTAERVAAMMTGRGEGGMLAPFDLARFEGKGRA